MTVFGDLNIEMPLILAVFKFISILISCSVELSMKFFL